MMEMPAREQREWLLRTARGVMQYAIFTGDTERLDAAKSVYLHVLRMPLHEVPHLKLTYSSSMADGTRIALS